MYFKEFVKTKWLETAYLIVCVIFLFNLHKLNIILLKAGLDSKPLELIIFDGYRPLIYLVETIFLFLIGAGLIVLNWRSIMHSELSLKEMAFAILGIILVAVTMFFLLKFINNPILQAFLVFFTVGGGVCVSEL